jgi:hypothetical protein
VPKLSVVIYDNPEAFKGPIPTSAYARPANIPQIVAAKYLALSPKFNAGIIAVDRKMHLLPIEVDWFSARAMWPDRAGACWSSTVACGRLRKSIDTYTVLGPWLVIADELTDPSQLSLELSVNGEIRQKANTRDLMVNVPELIAFATSFYTLMPGDVLLTGTPEGVGPIKSGDSIQSSISSIGTMTTPVESTEAPRGNSSRSKCLGPV